MKMEKGLKGQYFSFDAIIATVIVVIAMTSLLTYWFSVQSVVDAKSNYLQSAAANLADTLMSPGIPENWTIPVKLPDGTYVLPVQQIGLTNGYTNDINESKVRLLQILVNNVNYRDASDAYNQTKNLFHLGGEGEEYYIVIEQTKRPNDPDQSIVMNLTGCPYPTYPQSAAEVAIAHRGGTWIPDFDPSKGPKPVRLLVAVWRQNASDVIPCPPKPANPTPT